MKNSLIALSFLLIPFFLRSQQFATSWSKEIKVKETSVDMKVIAADNTGVYMIKMVWGNFSRTAQLFKYNLDNQVVFETNFLESLKGLDCHLIVYRDGELFAFFQEHEKKLTEYRLYGAKIDKNSGALITSPQLLSVHTMNTDKEDLTYTINPISNSKNWLLTEDYSAENFSTAVLVFSPDFKVLRKSRIAIPVNPSALQMENMLPTEDDKWILVGREMELPTKRHEPILFKRYTILLIGANGKKEKDFAPESDNHFIKAAVASAAIPGHLLIGGIASPNRISGNDYELFYYNIDIKSGTILSSSFKNLPLHIAGSSHKMKKEEDLMKYYKFKDPEINPVDNTPLFIAEQSFLRYYSSSSGSYVDFLTQDLIVFEPDQKGQINWITSIPKRQIEEIANYGGAAAINNKSYYSSHSEFFPAYSSFCSGVFGSNLVIIYNDEKKNLSVRDEADDLREMRDVKGSSIQAIVMNLKSGTYQKKMIQEEQTDDLAAMPQFAIRSGTQFILCGRRLRMSKTEFNLGKITVQQ